jgi:hypothetical protein
MTARHNFAHICILACQQIKVVDHFPNFVTKGNYKVIAPLRILRILLEHLIWQNPRDGAVFLTISYYFLLLNELGL